MSSLDLLDYQVGLDAALAQPGPDGRPLLPAGLRRQAVREARGGVDAMAVRFALLDERPLPEDLDYLRALEAVKPPAQAAHVLARRRPVYAARRRRRLVTTWTILGVLVLFVAGLAYLATSEEASTLALIDHNTASHAGRAPNATFLVEEGVDRLHLDGTFLLRRDAEGVVEVRLLDPAGNTRVYEVFAPRGNVYLRENVYAPEPGEWTLLVDFNSAEGSVRVEVTGVRPAR